MVRIVRRYALVSFITLVFVFGTLASELYKFPPTDRRFDSVASAVLRREFHRDLHPDKDSADILLMEEMARRSRDPRQEARSVYWNVRTNQFKMLPDSSISILKATLDNLNPGSDYDRACLYYQLARNYERVGKYPESWRLLREATAIFSRYEDDYQLGNCYLLSGLIFQELYNPEPAIENFELARKHYTASGHPLNRVDFFLAAQTSDSDPDKAELLYRRSVEEGAGDDGMNFQAYINLAYLHMKKGDLAKARKAVAAARSIVDNQLNGNLIFENLMLTTEGDLCLQEGDREGALEKFHKVESIISSNQIDSYEPKIFYKLYELYSYRGDVQKSLKYLESYVKAFQAQVEELRRQQITHAKATEDIAHEHDAMLRLEEEARYNRSKFYYSLTVSILLLIIAAIGLRQLLKRMRFQKMEAEELQRNLIKEQKETKLVQDMLEKDLLLKDHEVNSTSLHLERKNDLLQRVETLIRKFANEHKMTPYCAEEIERLIGRNLRNDEEWDKFKVNFEVIHPQFFSHLRKYNADLTDHDLRLCAYIRAGIRTRQIAEMTGVNQASVNTSRYRLRKKLDLPKESSLEDFLRNM